MIQTYKATSNHVAGTINIELNPEVLQASLKRIGNLEHIFDGIREIAEKCINKSIKHLNENQPTA